MGLNVCTQEEQKKCQQQIGDGMDYKGTPFIDSACKDCDKKKSADINPYVIYLFNLRKLQKARYPFHKNDLPYQTWLDLGMLNEMVDGRLKIH